MNKWIICIERYDIDGVTFTRGEMTTHNPKVCRGFSKRHWRYATDEEVAGIKRHRGKHYNLDHI